MSDTPIQEAHKQIEKLEGLLFDKTDELIDTQTALTRANDLLRRAQEDIGVFAAYGSIERQRQYALTDDIDAHFASIEELERSK